LLEDEQTLEVGRANEKLRLASDPRLSRKHFVIRYKDRQIEITHLSRTNPTLVAVEDSPEFEPVQGKQIEERSCRIIAGSHRFVAVVEAPDSIIEPTLSGEDHDEIWSDVDAEPDPLSDSFDEPLSDPSKPVDSARATLAGANVPKSPPPSPAPQSSKPVFSLDDSIDERVEKPPKVAEKPSPRKEVPTEVSSKDQAEEKSDGFGDKPFFPIEDDFFD
jgi:hypothetical protein